MYVYVCIYVHVWLNPFHYLPETITTLLITIPQYKIKSSKKLKLKFKQG